MTHSSRLLLTCTFTGTADFSGAMDGSQNFTAAAHDGYISSLTQQDHFAVSAPTAVTAGSTFDVGPAGRWQPEQHLHRLGHA